MTKKDIFACQRMETKKSWSDGVKRVSSILAAVAPKLSIVVGYLLRRFKVDYKRVKLGSFCHIPHCLRFFK